MGDDFRKVRPGDKFRMPAKAYNAFIDMARDWQDRQHDAESSAQAGSGPDSTVVLVKNATGVDQSRFAVLGISGPIYTPDDNLDSFKNKLAFVGAVPTTASYTCKFAILLEPAVNGAIVRAVVAGVVAVQVDISDANHSFAEVKDSSSVSLKSAAIGSAQILWKQSGTGLKWALVRLNSPLAGTLANPATLGSAAEGSESVATNTWTRDGITSGSNYAGVPLDLWMVSRVVYNDLGDKCLYAFVRKLSFDSLGLLRAVSSESRIVVDAPELCS
jgi:hypothetical protein